MRIVAFKAFLPVSKGSAFSRNSSKISLVFMGQEDSSTLFQRCFLRPKSRLHKPLAPTAHITLRPSDVFFLCDPFLWISDPSYPAFSPDTDCWEIMSCL